MSNENKPNWNDLQNEQAYTNAWQIDKIWMTAKKLPVYFWVMSLLLIALIGVTLQQNKIIKNMTKATHEKTESNREQAKKFFQMRKQNEDALRDQIEKLNLQIEDHKKQKFTLRVQLEKANDLSAKQAQIIAKTRTQDLAQQMLNEAYQTIAMNAVPLNLQQYLSVASDEQWIGYAQMASDRNSYNVIKTIASIPALMKIEKVASIVNDYSQAMGLADHNN